MNIKLNLNEARLVSDALLKLVEANKKEAYKAEYYPGYCENPKEKIKSITQDNLVMEVLVDILADPVEIFLARPEIPSTGIIMDR